MIYVISGGAKAFAVIGVTYPAGSVCTCSDGIKTLKLKDTGGQDFFLIPYAGTWTVTCTDGENKKSESVEITSEGQSVSVELSYETYIYKQGETDITLNSDWALPSSPPVDDWRYSGDSVSLESDGSVKSSGGKLVRALKVDLTDVNELFFEVKISAYKYKGHVGVATAWPYSNSDFTYVAKTDFADTTDVQIVTVDTSALTGEYWVGGYFASLTTTNLYNIWY